MKVQKLTAEDIPRIIKNLDKKLPENNPSIFMAQSADNSTFDNDFLFHQLEF